MYITLVFEISFMEAVYHMHGVIGLAPAASISKLYKTLMIKETFLLSPGNVQFAG